MSEFDDANMNNVRIKIKEIGHDIVYKNRYALNSQGVYKCCKKLCKNV